jgi:acetate kinase
VASGIGSILTVNAGSSSLKLRVLGPGDEVLAAADHGSIAGEAELGEALAVTLEEGAPIAAAGHRVVHGGPDFDGPAAIDASVEDDLAALADLAPLHNPPALAAIRALEALRPRLPAVACFDTSFHATIPAAAATYAIPAAWRERWPLRRYGFHGLSHAYAARRAAELLGRPAAELRLVVAHLGSGASLAAIEGGRSVETTMGFTPLEGLVMATRSGSVDPGLLLWVQRHGELGAEEMERALDRESGLLALSGRSGDMREILAGADDGEARCQLALDVYIHRLVGAAAAMAAAMGGLDALVFTGGVGEHAPRVRALACEGLAFLGAAIEAEANARADGDGLLSPSGATVATVLVEAREDIEIARQVRAVLPGPGA